MEYRWCLHCERVWPEPEWEAKGWDCPTPGCDGCEFDAWEWGRFVELWGYPKDPTPGTIYDQYGKGPELG